MNEPTTNSVIRITHDEANSSHVDDLLKRQMSMRGDPGVSRAQGRKWWLQSWFILMIAGLLGAIGAWAIVEPRFDDMRYMQGPIGAIDISPTVEMQIAAARDSLAAGAVPVADMKFNGERVFLLAGTRELKGGKSAPLDMSIIKDGEIIGLYVEKHHAANAGANIAHFIVRNPKPQPESKKMNAEEYARDQAVWATLLFPLVAAGIGLFIGCIDGIVCRQLRRALLGGLIGVLVGFVGGFVCSTVANVVYSPMTEYARKQSAGQNGGLTSLGFGIQMLGRTLAWGLVGLSMGVGPGIAMRSQKLIAYGLIGGVVGGLVGGLLFDPIDQFLLGPDRTSAHMSRLIGIGAIGACVGMMIGVVELLARDAWLRMTQGPLKGKEFLLFKEVMNVGSSPRSDLYLFNDPLVAEHHAVIRAVGDEYEIESRQSSTPVLVNGRSVNRARLRHGDNVGVGRTEFIFQKKK